MYSSHNTYAHTHIHMHARTHTRTHTHAHARTHIPFLCRKRTTLEKRDMEARVQSDHRPSTHRSSLLLLAPGLINCRVLWMNWQWQLLLFTLCRWPSQIVSLWYGKVDKALGPISSQVSWTNWQWQLLLFTLCWWPSQIVSPWYGKVVKALGPISSQVSWTNWQWQLLLFTLCWWSSQNVSPWNGKLGDAVSSLLQTLRTLMVPGDIILETNQTNPSLGKMNV